MTAADELTQELTALRDRYMRLLTTQARDERAYKAAANERAWRQALANYETRIVAQVRDDLLRLARLVQDPEYLPEKPSARQVRNMRTQAHALHNKVSALAGGDEQLAELARIMRAVRAAGEKQHADHGVSDGTHCVCCGCELFRAVYSEATAA